MKENMIRVTIEFGPGTLTDQDERMEHYDELKREEWSPPEGIPFGCVAKIMAVGMLESMAAILRVQALSGNAGTNLDVPENAQLLQDVPLPSRSAPIFEVKPLRMADAVAAAALEVPVKVDERVSLEVEPTPDGKAYRFIAKLRTWWRNLP